MARNVVQVLASYPIGLIADKVGARAVLVCGYALGSATAVLMALAFWFKVDSVAALAGIFVIAGLYVTVQDTLESTVTAEMVSRDTLAMSVGALGTVNGTAKFISSSAVGLAWTAFSPILGFGLAAIAMLAGTLMLRYVSRSNR